MGVLAEYLQTEAERLRADRRKRNEIIREWQESVRQLLTTLAGWLEKADAGLGLIGWQLIEDEPTSEPRLGQYRCPRLSVLGGDGEFFAEVANLIPRARFVAATLKPAGREPRAADGMVILSDGPNSRIAAHYLFRWRQADGDEWFICSDAEWNSRDFGNVHPLTPETFEVAVLGAVR